MSKKLLGSFAGNLKESKELLGEFAEESKELLGEFAEESRDL